MMKASSIVPPDRIPHRELLFNDADPLLIDAVAAVTSVVVDIVVLILFSFYFVVFNCYFNFL